MSELTTPSPNRINVRARGYPTNDIRWGITRGFTEYVRADLYDQLQAEIADLKARLEEAETKVNVTDSWLRKIIGHHAMYEGQDRNATSREYAQHCLLYTSDAADE